MAGTKNVTVIPARGRAGNIAKIEYHQKLKVAAYCRVSTDSDEQATSYEAQVEHYTNFIKKNSEWEFAGVYADDGISGTNTKKREEFNRMIEECMSGEIDMVITKSISRFARNTLDCLKYIRQLKEKNVPVYFEKENINTMDSKGEILLTIMASLAQQESESLSKNVKMGLQFRYQKGEVQVNHNWFLGYTKDEKGHLIIDPEQAVIVKRIYREYLEGKTLLQIARGLMTDGIHTAANKPTWRPCGVRKILTNEKYIGDALLQKTYTVDVLTKKRVVNNGIVPQYYVENNHEAIIPRDIYTQVQEELARRANLPVSKNGVKRTYSSRYALSSRMYCGKCGDTMRRVSEQSHNKKKHLKWKCATRVNNGPSGCDADTITEKEVHNTIVRAINKTLSCKEDMLMKLQKNIEDSFVEQSELAYKEIDAELLKLQEQLLQRVNANTKHDDIAGEIERLRNKKHSIYVKDSNNKALKTRIEEMKEFLEQQTTRIKDYDEQLVIRLIEKITVYDDKFVFEFRSGTTLDLKR